MLESKIYVEFAFQHCLTQGAEMLYRAPGAAVRRMHSLWASRDIIHSCGATVGDWSWNYIEGFQAGIPAFDPKK